MIDLLIPYYIFVAEVDSYLKSRNFDQASNEEKKQIIDEIFTEYLNRFLTHYSNYQIDDENFMSFVENLRKTEYFFYSRAYYNAAIMIFTNYLCYLIGEIQQQAIMTTYNKADTDLQIIYDLNSGKITVISIKINDGFIDTFEDLYNHLWTNILIPPIEPTPNYLLSPHY